LGLWILTWLQAIEDIVVLIDIDAATRAATGTDAVFGFQPPDALLVQEVLAAQRTNRTEVDHVAGEFIVARVTREDIDLFVSSAADDLQFGRSTDLARESHAARTHDAAVGEQRDLIADVVLIGLNVLGLLQTAVAATVFVAVVLQPAFTGLIADGAIERMVEKEVFEGRLLGVLDLLAVRNDDRAVLHRSLAAGKQLGLHHNRAVGLLVTHLDKAHAATGNDRQVMMVAVVGDLDANPLCCLNAV
jgi:hypothetical protein